MTVAYRNIEQIKSDLNYLKGTFLLFISIPFLLAFLLQIELPKFEIKWLFVYFFSAAFFYLLSFLLISMQTFSRSTSVLVVCKENKKMEFVNYFTKKHKQIEFNQLDGYVTGRMKNYIGRFPSEKNKIIWIVKDGKMIERIDEHYIFNYNELEEELKEMKYLGYQKIRIWKRFKMLFGPISID